MYRIDCFITFCLFIYLFLLGFSNVITALILGGRIIIPTVLMRATAFEKIYSFTNHRLHKQILKLIIATWKKGDFNIISYEALF